MGGVAAGEDIFQGAGRILVKKEWAPFACNFEPKNRYKVSQPHSDNTEGEVFLYMTEESACLERVCCNPHRSLKLLLHAGNSKEFPVIMEMLKPFSCQEFCCMRPKFTVTEQGSLLGEVLDPCRFCTMDQQVLGATNNLLFTTEGLLCQAGNFFPLCSGVEFKVKKGDEPVARIEKMALGMEECLCGLHRFMISFDGLQDPVERKMLLASVMLLGFAYFERGGN